MFKLVSYIKDADKCFGVLDTNDFSVEFVDMDTVKQAWQRGIEIKGLCKENRVVNIKIQKPVIPDALIKKVDTYLNQNYVGYDDTMCDYKKSVLAGLGQMQKFGTNLRTAKLNGENFEEYL